MILLILLLNLNSVPSAFAGDLLMDAASREDLTKTQELLRDPKHREKPSVEIEKSRWINDHVKSLAGSKENTQEIFELSAEIFGTIAQEAGGDPTKMMEILEKYKKNPQSLDKKLSPQQRQRLKEISGKSETQKPGPGQSPK
ncbi:MAG: hypothetical protein AABZ55_12805 [Bdellovibrionota bacterium]